MFESVSDCFSWDIFLVVVQLKAVRGLESSQECSTLHRDGNRRNKTPSKCKLEQLCLVT